MIQTKNLIDTCLDSNLEKFIFVSTCSNYGISQKKESLDEKSHLKPLSLYAKAKVDAEKYIKELDLVTYLCYYTHIVREVSS